MQSKGSFAYGGYPDIDALFHEVDVAIIQGQFHGELGIAALKLEQQGRQEELT